MPSQHSYPKSKQHSFEQHQDTRELNHGSWNIGHYEGSGPWPLSMAQHRLWYLDQLYGSDDSYHISKAYRLSGLLDIPALEDSVASLVRRHESLRTTFVIQDGKPLQQVSEALDIPIQLVNVSSTGNAQLNDLLHNAATQPFDLSKDALLRLTVFMLSDEESVLLLVIHHIVSDGWSMSLLFKELSVLYTARRTGKEILLPPLPVQYVDYTLWQRQHLRGKTLDRELEHWQKTLADLPGLLELPTDRSRPLVRGTGGAKVNRIISLSLCEQLKVMSRHHSCTFYMTLLAAFHLLLYRYTGRDDPVIGTPIAGRDLQELEELIGFFVNTLVIKGDLSGDPTFDELMSRTRRIALEAFTHSSLPFERLVEELNPTRDMRYTPLIQVMFILQNAPKTELTLEGLKVRPMEMSKQSSKFDLTLSVTEQPTGLSINFEYATDLFDQSTIERMADHYQRLLQEVVKDPSRPISALPMLSDGELRQLLVDWNDTPMQYPCDATVHALFEAQVRSTPEKTAVICGGETLSYADLNTRANQLAHFLIDRGVVSDTLIGMCFERSIEMIVTLFGILKSGSAYVPLDPNYPATCLAFMLKDSGVKLLITQAGIIDQLSDPSIEIIRLDSDWETFAGISGTNQQQCCKPHHLAYVIYTSGSTGMPKGVQITHRAVVNFLNSMRHAPGLEATDTLLSVTTLSFDIAVLELYLPLTTGARVELVKREISFDGARLAQCIAASGATIMQATPATWRMLLDSGWQGNANLKALCGGETLPRDLIHRLLPIVGELWNMYGPTEATVWSTIARISEYDKPVSIGRPIANTRIYVLDGNLQPQPIGVPGELYIAGSGLARGYLNRPELTAERFMTIELYGAAERLYQTGDRARWRTDGYLEHLGRLDHQIKFHGFRIELGEIEAVLIQHEMIREAVVTVRGADENQHLAAYFTMKEPDKNKIPGSSIAPETLRAYVTTSLPEHMVPSSFTCLDALPMTPNGKYDRNALPKPEQVVIETTNTARDDTDVLLCSLWTKVLGHNVENIEADFFAQGGHSLLVTQLAARVRDCFGVELPVMIVFERPSLRAQADWLTSQHRQDSDNPLVRQNPNAPKVLSHAQQRLWFLAQIQGTSAIYNMPTALMLDGPLDQSALDKSLRVLVEHQQSLRLTFPTLAGHATLHELPSYNPLNILDLRGIEESRRQTTIDAEIQAHAVAPFNLAVGPLFQARLLIIDAERQVLLLNCHHIIADGWSIGILIRQWGDYYAAIHQGKHPKPSKLAVDYSDYAAWQRNYLSGGVLEKQLTYWRSQLAGAPTVMELPSDRPRPFTQSYHGAQLTRILDKDQCEDIQALCQQHGTTLFMTLLCVFQVLLARYSGQNDILVGSPIANRTRTETEGLIGLFVNTLVLRSRIDPEVSFNKLLDEVRRTALDAYAHQDIPFEQLVEVLNPERSLSHSPLFQVMFVLQNAPANNFKLPGLTLTPVGQSSLVAKFDLTLSITARKGQFHCRFEYATDLFDPSTIERMADHYQQLLQEVVKDPSRPISALPMLTDGELRQLLIDWNDTSVPYPRDTTVHALFEAQVERTPKGEAVICAGESLTYAELSRRSNILAQHLKALGVGPEILVGICTDRSLEVVVGMLGIMKAGGAYVPLDPEYPQSQLEYMLEDTAAPVLLTKSGLSNRFSAYAGVKVDLQNFDWFKGCQDDSYPTTKVTAENLAYVMYTSGSTGKPKGVEIRHRGIVRLVKGLKCANLSSGQNLLQLSAISFDASTFEIWGALLNGGHCILFPEAIPNVETMKTLQQQHNITTLWLTASLFNLVIDTAPEVLSGISTVLTGGEALSVPHVKRALQSLPDTKIVNGYGPTEGTTFSCCHPMQGLCLKEPVHSIPIGRPIENTQCYVLDSNAQLMPVGVPGELHIGGDGLARGYLNRPDLTKEKFIANPFSDESDAQLYKTGDLVRYLADGNLEFLGRIDRQVKLRGFRIEPGEIETVLTQHESVSTCVIMLRQDTPGGARLVAYVVADNDSTLKSSELSSYAKARLPKIMVPQTFLLLHRLPLTANGKLDREALRKMEIMEYASSSKSNRTASVLEQRIASLMAEVLTQDSIDIEEDFFEKGGSSLTAIDLVYRIKKQLGLNMQLDALWIDGASPVAIASTLKELDQTRKQDNLVELKAGGNRSPLFCIHTLGGDIFHYVELAKHMDASLPVFGIRLPAADSSAIGQFSVLSAAKNAAHSIRQKQPNGPYLLCGWSSGGIIALEIARLLGAEYSLVVMIDTFNFNYQKEPSSYRRALSVLRRVADKVWDYPLSAILARGVPFLKRLWAYSGYVSQRYDQRLVLIRSSESIDSSQDPYLGWKDIADAGVDLEIVEGNHEAIMQEPCIRETSARLQRYLDNYLKHAR